jgi:hypothetical protein
MILLVVRDSSDVAMERCSLIAPQGWTMEHGQQDQIRCSEFAVLFSAVLFPPQL